VTAGYNAARAMHVPVSSSQVTAKQGGVVAWRGRVGLVTAMWGLVRWCDGKASQGDGKAAFGGDSYAQAMYGWRSNATVGQGMILYCAGGVR
jgi:hypothetical protein